MKHACVLVVVVALALAPTASADAPWSTPTRVAGSSDGPVYDMWFGRSGGGLLGALCCNGFGSGVPGTTLSSSDGGNFDTWRVARKDIAVREFAGTGSERYGLGWIATGSSGADTDTDTGVARVTANGLGRPFRVLPRLAVSSQLARTTAGTSAIIGQVSVASKDRRTRRSIYLTVRGVHRGFSRAVKLAGKGDRAWLGVAVTDDGRALAVWARNGGVFARERSANGTLGPTWRLAADGNAGELSVALAPNGAAAVAWLSRADFSPADKPTELRLALRPPGGHFAAPRTLEQVTGQTEQIQLTPVGHGQILVGWLGQDQVVRVTSSDGSSLGATETLSAPNTYQLQIVAAVGGEAVAKWSELGANGRVLRAAPRPAAATQFDAAQTIAGPAPIEFSFLAYDPSGTRMAAAWDESGVVYQSYLRLSSP
jgi:hypothetical protein